MSVISVIGAQWGDEGKGKVTDFLAQKVDVVVRGNGGDNAGHTVINHLGEFKLHIIPSGIFYPDTICVIGNGTVINSETVRQEIASLIHSGAKIGPANLKISSRAHLIMPYHILLDEAEEKSRGRGEIGTTKRGIGPCYADKVARKGIRVGDLPSLKDKAVLQRIHSILEEKREILNKVYGVKKSLLPDFSDVFEWLLSARMILGPYIENTELFLNKALADNKNILLEGAQGTGLDIDFGTYHHVTSSDCTAAGACKGAGIPPAAITEVIGVVKAYVTRVGSKEQPLPTEMPEDTANILREHAHEYGATTGRPRRCGWLDIPQIKYHAMVNGFTSLAVTRMDNLGILPEVQICSDYDENGKPIYEVMSGWDVNIKGYRHFSNLPPNAKKYLNRMERLIGLPLSIRYVSVGSARDQMIVKRR